MRDNFTETNDIAQDLYVHGEGENPSCDTSRPIMDLLDLWGLNTRGFSHGHLMRGIKW
jgi:hypothetical protein